MSHLDSYLIRAEAPGPKKLLALSGGGMRGVLSLEILAGLEAMLRRELDAPDDFVLADYFDYMAGTSTGAIIAAGLARGLRVDTLRELYALHGADMFDRATLLRKGHHLYESGRLEAVLKEVLGADVTLGDPRLRTLLMMVLRNATTDSPWPLSNAPGAKYNARDRADCNLDLPLWQLVRASTAAPVYFAPEVIRIGQRSFVFVDGGVTMYNNPSFQLFLQATLPAYGLSWPTGEHHLLLVAVGTGTAPKADDRLRPGAMNALFNVKSVPAALMSAALHEQDLLCRVFGRCRHGAPLDREIGTMVDVPTVIEPRLFSYVVYDADLTRHGLDALGLPDVNPDRVQPLDSVEHIGDLQRIGLKVAERHVDRHHFDGFLTSP